MLVLIHFGWGKPVQFDPYNLRSPRRDGAMISLAGPTSNILLAILCSLVIRLPIPAIFTAFLVQLLIFNVVLAIFNLVPIHPLDGFKVVEGILPPRQAAEWHELERYGMIFLLALLLPIFGGGALISRLISPVITSILTLLLPGSPLL
jgi:Zn-dependent protease